MDGLALLCTLHADGPATLKRLRSAGCANLTALLERPITEVALALDVAPAAARRLLREARLLAERVGPELEAEEGPAPVAATAGPATGGVGPLTLELPPVTPASTLDRGDRALLERIVREGRAARGEAPESPEVALPGLAPAPSALERAGLDLGADGPWPAVAPESLSADVETAALAARGAPAIDHTPVAAGPDLAPLLALEGVDASLAHALVRAGVGTLAGLARADALVLARELRVTLAQAKRLCFLARRAQGPATERVGATAGPRPTSVDARPPQPALSAPPAETRSEAPLAAPRPAWRIEPRTQPLTPAQEPPAAPAAAARPRFWEPRSGLGADAPERLCEPQGVLVDPSEVDRPRRFSEVRRSAAQHAALHVGGHPTPEPKALPPAGGTTLGWNFEIPRPELPPAPAAAPCAAPARRTWRPLEADETSAGPFA